MTNVVQRNFTGGEITPSLYARTDLARYATSTRQMRNFIARRFGGASNRGGTQLVAEIKDSTTTARLLEFVFELKDASNTYVLEFGDHYVRFAQLGAPIITSGVAAWVTSTAYKVGDLVTDGGSTYYCTAAHTSGATTEPGVGTSWHSNWYKQAGAIYEIPSPYAYADLPLLQITQSLDVITIVHPDYPVYELSRYAHTKWTLLPVTFGPPVGAPTGLTATGGAVGATQWWAVTSVDAITGEESLPAIVSAALVGSTSTPVVLNWNQVPGAASYNIYRSTDGKAYGLISLSQGADKAMTNNTWTTSSATAGPITTQNAVVVSAGQARITVVSAATDKAKDGKYTISGSQHTSAGTGDGSTVGTVRAYYARDGEPRVYAQIVSSDRIIGSGDSTIAWSSTIQVPTDTDYTSLIIDLVPEVEGYNTNAASIQCDVTGTKVNWKAAQVGENDTGANANYAETPPTQVSLFDSANNYPSAVGYYQQRLMFGGTRNDPTKVWASRSSSFHSFTQSTPGQDDDAVIFRLAGQHVNAVQHLIELSRLIVFTSGAEYTIDGGQDNNNILTPTTIGPTKRTAAGSSALRPLTLVDTVLFQQARGTIIRDFRKALQDFDTSDVTLMAAHLFEGYSLVDWAYAQSPNSTIWAVRSDGILLGLTYLPSQEVWGWHRHDTDGLVENVCVVPEGGEDTVYLIVKRTINGVTKRYIERMVSRTITTVTDPRDLFFVDCGLTYDGRNTGTETLTLSGGVAWDQTEQLTLQRSIGGFAATDVTDGVVFQITAANGSVVRCAVEAYTDGTHVTVRADRPVPADLHGTATKAWARATKVFAGLTHLEAKKVSVLGDGFVEASPNNNVYPVVTVTGGKITIANARAVVHVGLPYISDLETLDIDTPQGESLKDRKINVSRVALWVEKSLGGWSGRSDLPTADEPLNGLAEFAERDDTVSYDTPVGLITGVIDANIDSTWNDHGRVLIRQVDPLPLTILAAIPQGYIG